MKKTMGMYNVGQWVETEKVSGKIVGFTTCKAFGHAAPMDFIVIELDNGYWNELHTLYTSMAVIHPSNILPVR